MDRSAYLYQLIIAQLRADGLHKAAQTVSESAMVTPDYSIPDQHLMRIVHYGLDVHRQQMAAEESQRNLMAGAGGAYGGRGLGLIGGAEGLPEIMSADATTVIAPYALSTMYLTQHRAPIRCSAFSSDGRFLVSGSQDSSIKLMDMEKVKVFARTSGAGGASGSRDGSSHGKENHPVLTTFLDHPGAVNDLVFHPRQPLLVSGGEDCLLKFFDCSRVQTNRRAKRSHQLPFPVRTMDFHPSGDFLLIGTDHNVVMLMDVNNLSTYAGTRTGNGDPMMTHSGAGISSVKYSPSGKLFVTAGRDGFLRFWDTTNGLLVREIPRAHHGKEVSSVQWARCDHIIMSSGRDGSARLWDLRNGPGNEQLKEYSVYGANVSKNINTAGPNPAVLSAREDVIVTTDDKNAIVVWNVRTGERMQHLGGHSSFVRTISASPTEPYFFSGSNDFRGRIWGPASSD